MQPTGQGGVVGNVGKWAVAAALIGAACAKGHVTEPTNKDVVPPVDAGPIVDAGTPDAGPPDAGPPDAGPADGGGIKLGGPGAWPIGNVQYSWQEGIQEMPVVGVSSDENQNLWVATNAALYLRRPGDQKFTRFDASNSDLHLPGNPAKYCEDSALTYTPKEGGCPSGEGFPPGISEIVGGGAGDGYVGEVFVGYWGYHDWTLTDGTEQDPWRHSGKLDRVRLKADKSGALSLEVIRFDMVSNNTVQFWHNKTVLRMVYDHFIHPHELYVGCDHGVDKISPDKWKPSVGWFLSPENQQSWMSDHLHPRACFHQHCVDDSNLRLADWRGLAIDAQGDLWVGGRYAAGKLRYIADNTLWWMSPRPDGQPAAQIAFGDPYDGNCSGNRPIFCAPMEGDPVNISAVTVAKDGKIWFASGTLFNEPQDVPYGIASLDGFHLTYYDPVRDVGLPESHVRDMVALPDGRLVVAGLSSGLVFWDPVTGKNTVMRAGQGIPSDRVLRIQLDTMFNPPALMVATAGGAAVLRVLP
jgi:hypothetical protein